MPDIQKQPQTTKLKQYTSFTDNTSLDKQALMCFEGISYDIQLKMKLI